MLIFHCLTGIGVYLLFFLQLDLDDDRRSLDQLWNFGHFVIFALVSYFGLQLAKLKLSSQLSSTKTLLTAIIFALLAGSMIELIQREVGRSASWMDLSLDVSGALFAACLILYRSCNKDKGEATAIYPLAATLLLTLSLSPTFAMWIDEQHIKRQLPSLTNFYSPLAKSRILPPKSEGDANYDFCKQVLCAEFSTARFSSLRLQHFYRDWSSYDTLQFSVVNPTKTTIHLEFRIDDTQHRKNNRDYHDRFNRRLLLQPGHNHFEIDLEDIETAPQNRLTDMTSINSIIFFTNRLAKPITLKFSEIKLTRL